MADELTRDTKPCPLCGELIKTVAIRCKHCHADLSNLGPSQGPRADFDRGLADSPAQTQQAPHTVLPSEHDFEQRFLDFAYETQETLTSISVAHALKVPIAFADERLEALAAAELILRDVDDEGGVFYALPGRRRAAQSTQGLGNSPGNAMLSQRPGSMSSTAMQPAFSSSLQSSSSSASTQIIPQHIVHGDGTITLGPPPPTEAAAVTGLVLNLCLPGVGSIVAGKPGPGVAQLAMLVAGIPLCFVLIGFPIVFAAWLWALMTAATALQEARRADARA